MNPRPETLKLFLIAGEHSGDQIGGPLIAALREVSGLPLTLSGVGGEAMAAQGCKSIFPLSDVAVMGPIAIVKQLLTIVRRVYQTVDAVIAANPHALIILDSPEFTHAVAKRVRRRRPDIPVIDYVSPSVWAWRPGRAKRMRRYIDHILAILPFEPEAHESLGGPACTYVGHPLIERMAWIKSRDTTALKKSLGFLDARPVIAILPGSRSTEIRRMMPVYGETLRHIIKRAGAVNVVVPVAWGREEQVKAGLSNWPCEPHLVHGDDHKFTAFRLADAALATSGTVTLELALCGTPMVVAYRTEVIVAIFRWMLKAHSIVLPNLVLGENTFPEFIQEDASPQALAGALLALLDKASPERERQEKALARIETLMNLPSGTPSERAAKIVLELARVG